MKNYILIAIALSSHLLLGCKKFIEIDPPRTSLVTSAIYNNDESAISALTSIYTSMMDQSAIPNYTLAINTGFMGDELKNNSTLIQGNQLYTNTKLNPLDAPTNSIWSIGFNIIYRANGVIEGCQQSTKLSPAVKKQLIAEAKFLRAYWNFYLLNLYGDIPLILTTEYASTSTASRETSDKIYSQIETDLMSAETDLNENYVASNSVDPTNERVRPNKYTASAFLARVYLYNEQYTKALSEANKVIDKNSIYNLESVESVFLSGSKETVWSLMMPYPNGNRNTFDGSNFILNSPPISYSLSHSATISDQLYSAFEVNDLRKVNWIGTFTDNSAVPSVDYHFPNKYKVVSSSVVTENTVVFRLAEIVLIRAEAYAQQGNISDAINDTDLIRKRAGLSLIKNTNPNITKEELLKVILKERQKELFTEWGHRWLDLKRTNTIDQVMVVVSPLKGGTWSAYKALWPIPQNDINNNPKMKQNPGYN